MYCTVVACTVIRHVIIPYVLYGVIQTSFSSVQDNQKYYSSRSASSGSMTTIVNLIVNDNTSESTWRQQYFHSTPRLIEIRRIGENGTHPTDENVTLLLLAGEQSPTPVEATFDDVLAIVTGPPTGTERQVEQWIGATLKLSSTLTTWIDDV